MVHTKTHIFTYLYQHYSVLFTMVPRNRCSTYFTQPYPGPVSRARVRMWYQVGVRSPRAKWDYCKDGHNMDPVLGAGVFNNSAGLHAPGRGKTTRCKRILRHTSAVMLGGKNTRGTIGMHTHAHASARSYSRYTTPGTASAYNTRDCSERHTCTL